jgi:hypothetical protein
LDLCTCLVTLETDPSNDFDEDVWDGGLDTDIADADRQSQNPSKGNATLRLAHSSVREYLLGRNIQLGPAREYQICESLASSLVAEMCLAYVLHADKAGQALGSAEKEWPLFRYAVDYWYLHAESGEGILDRSQLHGLITKVFGASVETYRLLTYPQVSMKFNPWLNADSFLDIRKLGNWAPQDLVNVCIACQDMTLENLETGYAHYNTYRELENSARAACQICILIHKALLYYWIAAHFNVLNSEEEIERAEAVAQVDISAKAGDEQIYLRSEQHDPFVLIRCSFYFGRLHLFADGGKDYLPFTKAKLKWSRFRNHLRKAYPRKPQMR